MNLKPGTMRLRILLAPHEICGQMGILARALRRRGHDAIALQHRRVLANTARSYQADRSLDLTSGCRVTRLGRQARSFLQLGSRIDVFHFFYGRSLLPLLLDLPLLRMRRTAILVHFRGRDITQKSKVLDADLNVHSCASRSDSRQRLLIRAWRAFADHLLVSTPDLLSEVPDAEHIPQVIELEQWHFLPMPVSPQGPVVIGHAATDRAMKGTDAVISSVRELQAQGFNLELRLMEGMQPDQVFATMKSCHIGIDQVIQGNYGNVAIEFMALGRPVISFISPRSQRGQGSVPPPVVSAGVGELTSALKSLLLSPRRCNDLAERGRSFVESTHCSDLVAERLERRYRALLQSRRHAGEVEH